MSRIGNAPITLPSGVEVSYKNNVVTTKGPKGELTQEIDGNINVEVAEGIVNVVRLDEEKETKAKHGLYRSLINNMVEGVGKGFKLDLELVGVGYRAAATGQQLDLSLGYSHNILFQLPNEIKVTTTSERGKNPTISLESHDKQLVGAVAAKIRSYRKPEPYKGKGIKFIGEQIRRKAGKSAAKK
jgi:large subunit ribosomal protein L6